MSAEEKKAAEANGKDALREVKSETNSDSTSEDLPQYRKRTRRVQYIYIAIAVVLGAALIGVLVYFSVTNALNAAEPVSEKQTADEPETTTMFFSTTESTTAGLLPDDNARLRDNRGPVGGGGNPLLRILPGMDASTAKPDFSDKTSLLRGGPMSRSMMPGPGGAPFIGGPDAGGNTDGADAEDKDENAEVTATDPPADIPDFSDRASLLRGLPMRRSLVPGPPAGDASSLGARSWSTLATGAEAEDKDENAEGTDAA